MEINCPSFPCFLIHSSPSPPPGTSFPVPPQCHLIPLTGTSFIPVSRSIWFHKSTRKLCTLCSHSSPFSSLFLCNHDLLYTEVLRNVGCLESRVLAPLLWFIILWNTLLGLFLHLKRPPSTSCFFSLLLPSTTRPTHSSYPSRAVPWRLTN